jgi:hypothetical protein
VRRDPSAAVFEKSARCGRAKSGAKDGGAGQLVTLELPLEPADVVWDQDCGPVGGHCIGLLEEVREDGAAGGEPCTELLLEGT